MFKELDPLLHAQLRLAVMSILLSVEEADFVYLREKTNATAGNLSWISSTRRDISGSRRALSGKSPVRSAG